MWNLCATGTQILRAADCNPFVGKPSGFFDSLKPPARISVRAVMLSVQLLCVKDVVADRGRIGQAAVEPRGVAGRGVDEVHTLTDCIVPLKGELCREHGILIRRETDAAVRRGRKLRHAAAPVEHDLLDAVGEALVRHAVEHDVADRDLPVHGLVAGLGIDDVAEPVDVTRAVEALTALEQLLPGRIDAQAGIIRAERGRDAEDLLQIRQRPPCRQGRTPHQARRSSGRWPCSSQRRRSPRCPHRRP